MVGSVVNLLGGVFSLCCWVWTVIFHTGVPCHWINGFPLGAVRWQLKRLSMMVCNSFEHSRVPSSVLFAGWCLFTVSLGMDSHPPYRGSLSLD